MMGLVLTYDVQGYLKKYSDYNKILLWAVESPSALNEQNIIKGYSATEIAPLENTSREQAILMSYRVYDLINNTPQGTVQ